MANKKIDNLKLGTFVLGSLLFLVLLLYTIGKNRNLFGSVYVLKARFENVQGLVAGNNVRFSGINSGTVKSIDILSDTVIEVTMMIEKSMQSVIHKNAIASIGTEGVVGNKVVNIIPSKVPGPLAVENDVLDTKKAVSTDEMLSTLNRTNNDIGTIASELKTLVHRLNDSSALWTLLEDKSIPNNIKASVSNIRIATAKAGKMTDNINSIITDVQNGKGSVGTLLKDSSFALNLQLAVEKIKTVGDKADALAGKINQLTNNIQTDVNSGKGPVNALLKDSAIVMKLNASLDNIQKGTDGFNQNMEALKHNFLFRGYFKKLEKQKKKELENQQQLIKNPGEN